MTRIRDFDYELKKSKVNLDKFYQEKLGAYNIQEIEDLELQFKGVDKIMWIGDKEYKVEEKIRIKDYGDLLFEIYSNLETRRPGRAIDNQKITDILVYYVKETKKIFLFDYKQLRNEIRKNLKKFYLLDKIKDAKSRRKNKVYTTRNIVLSYHEMEELGIDFLFYKL